MSTSLLRLMALLTLLLSGPLFALGSSSDYSSLPVTAVEATPPLLLLAMSRDHELYKKAYSDYGDIDGDGQIDTTYKDSITYIGYFDSNFCYGYSSNKFSPIGPVDASTHKCTTHDGWSGNFLNWATMTRIDLIRTVLYGGKRVADPATSTGSVVLERELIPPDIHAFAKVYDDTVSGAAPLAALVPSTVASSGAITLCNVSQWPNSTALSGTLDTQTYYPPLLRVATAAYPNWASAELLQCQWSGTANTLGDGDRPSGNDAANAYQVRVERCVATQDGPVSQRCRRYDNGTAANSSDDLWKPVGLLQRYGESGKMRFGLMTGSYDKNSHGGVLRKEIGLLGGTEINLTTGQIIASGMIGTLDKLRIATYKRAGSSASSPGSYQGCGDYVSADYVRDGSCADWGNPLGEIYLEALRYLAGASSPTAAYLGGGESTMITGLGRLNSWIGLDPYAFGPNNAAVPCAQCAVLLISTSQGSFDSLRDAADWPSSGLPAGFDPAIATNAVQTMEGLNGATVLLGRVGTTSIDQECTPKLLAVGSLANADGICPEASSAEGSYGIAGLAYRAATEPLRSGYPKAKTFAVSVAEDLPTFSVTSGGKQARVIPLCRSKFGSSGWVKCSLINVVSEPNQTPPVECGNNSNYHSFRLTWEGVSWGSDYDFDVEQRLEYCEVGGALKVRTAVVRDQAGAEFNFGFTLLGTNPQLPANYPAEVVVAGGINGSNGLPSAFQSLSITGGAVTLQKPLWLAAKYGGFNDLDNDGTPANSQSDNREWDSINNLTGAATPDGDPDNYFQLRNPSSLEAALNRIFAAVAGEVASGTAAAVVANNVSGEGAVYQALYHPRVEVGNDAISWAGTLHALFIDSAGRLREDMNGDAKLDGCDVDPVVEIFFDSVNLPTGTKIRRFTGGSADCSTIGSPLVLSLSELKTVWNARDQLAQVPGGSSIAAQRVFPGTALADTGRAIYTTVDGSTLADFTSVLASAHFSKLNAVDATEATNIIDFIRGKEGIAGFRSRTIDYDGNGAKPWLLGDIINSSPAVVGPPNASHDLRYGDSSYAVFKNQYANRRQLVYVGANDGMVHAFNGGFWDENSKTFKLKSAPTSTEVEHPLGSELWAYVPKNLLPHLRWLTETNYPHVFYVDGSAQSFDAKIFTADADHPNGWGTILVIGMRFGGSPITIGADTFRSAYVVLDVTNPEQPPKLIAEITDPGLGFTTGLPALVRLASNKWELLFGSGPTSTTLPLSGSDAISTQNAQLYRYDLVTKAFVTGFSPRDLGITAATSFVGDPLAQDWSGDGLTDDVYFGLIGGAANAQSGGIYRLDLANNATAATQVLDSSRPIIAAPLAVRDDQGKRWLYAGEGKLLFSTDRPDNGQNTFYGVRLPDNGSTIAAADLLRTDQVQVATSGLLIDVNGNLNPLVDGTATLNDFTALKSYIANNKKGWRYQLAAPVLSDPSARIINPPVRSSSTLFFTDFMPPNGSSCDFGDSRLYGLNYQTGTAAPTAALGDTGNPNNALRLALPYLNLGQGLSSKPVVYVGEGGKTSIITQQETGAMTSTNVNSGATQGRKSWRRLPLR